MSGNREPVKNTQGTTRAVAGGGKAAVVIGCGIVIALAILAFSDWVTTPNRKNSYFSYWSGEIRNGPVNVTDSNRVEVPITFDIGPGVSEVRLEFSGKHSRLAGLTLLDSLVRVVDGKAASTVIILFDIKPDIKAGTHFFEVVAKNSPAGKVIREGIIQLNYNMHEVIGKCSC